MKGARFRISYLSVVCEAMGDEMAEPWEGKTGDSSAWEASCADVYGEWRVVLNPSSDATYLEIAEYCKFRRLVMNYLYFVLGFERVRPLPEAVKTDLAALEDMIDVFPTKSQVLRHPRRGTALFYTGTYNADGVVTYHTSYLVFSDSQPFTRSAMLAHLPAVVAELKKLELVFKEALIEEAWASFDQLYGELVAAYETWRELKMLR
jgi:hypothetical protein